MSVASGHVDFQDYPAWRGLPLFHQAGYLLTSINPLHINASITNFAGLIIEVSNNFAAQPGCTVQLSNGQHIDVWIVQPLQELCVFCPILSAGGAVNVTTALAGTAAITVAVTPTNLQLPEYTYVFTRQAIRRLNVAVAAATTDGTNYPQICGGHGYLFYQPLDNSGSLVVTLQEVNEAAASVADIYTATMPAVANQPVTVAFDVPAGSYQFSVHNTDAVNPHSYNAYVNIGH